MERIIRTWGQTAVFMMSLLLLPACKNSLWLEAMGVSWDKALWVHRWLGVATLVCIACHVLSFWVRSAQARTLAHDALSLTPYPPSGGEALGALIPPRSESFTVALMQLVAYP